MNTIQEFFNYFKHVDPLIFLTLFILSIGIVWVMDIEKSPFVLYGFFLVLLLFVHFVVGG